MAHYVTCYKVVKDENGTKIKEQGFIFGPFDAAQAMDKELSLESQTGVTRVNTREYPTSDFRRATRMWKNSRSDSEGLDSVSQDAGHTLESIRQQVNSLRPIKRHESKDDELKESNSNESFEKASFRRF